MQLSKALQSAGVTRWQKAAKYYNLSHLEFASSRLYQELLNMFRDSIKLHKIINSLPETEQRLLKGIAITQSMNYLYDSRHWRSYLNYFLSRKLEALTELQNRGLIYLNPRHQYYIPIEISEIILEIMQKKTLKDLQSSAMKSYMYSGGEIAIGDVIRFLDALRKRKVRITLANKFYKTDYERFSQQYSLEQDIFKFNIGNRLDFIYKYTIASQLAIINKGTLNITEQGKIFNEVPPNEMWHNILKYWTLKYPTDAASRVAITVLFSIVIKLLPPSKAMSIDSLNNMYLENGGVIPIPTGGKDWLLKTVNELMYLGILSCGLNCKEVSLSEKAMDFLDSKPSLPWMQEVSFVTQPNLEILLSSHANPIVHWRLAGFCEDEGGNEMYRYKITKHSIYTALLQGWSISEIIRFINCNSKLGVPKNVIQALEDWGSKFGKLYFMETCLLCCRDKAVLREIRQVPDFAQYIEGIINESTLVVLRENYLSLLNELEKKGYMPYQQLFNSKNVPFTNILKEEK